MLFNIIIIQSIFLQCYYFEIIMQLHNMHSWIMFCCNYKLTCSMRKQQGHADVIEMTLSSITRFLKSIMSIKTHVQYNVVYMVKCDIVINNLSLLFVKESFIMQAKGLL